MSMFAQRPGAGRDEVGEKIASFPTYEQAQKAVSSLIAGEVPARDIAIVGSGLRSIERVALWGDRRATTVLVRSSQKRLSKRQQRASGIRSGSIHRSSCDFGWLTRCRP